MESKRHEVRYCKYHEVRTDGSCVRIDSPVEASLDAKYIVREECVSDSSMRDTVTIIYFVDRRDVLSPLKLDGKYLKCARFAKCKWSDDFDMTLVYQYNDGGLTCQSSRYNDVRCGILTYTGDEEFRSQWRNWSKCEPLEVLVSNVRFIERYGHSRMSFVESEVREQKERARRKKLEIAHDYKLIVEGLKSVCKVEFPEGIERLAQYSLEELSNLETVVLPSTIKELPPFSLFAGRMKNVYCKAHKPPKIHSSTFGMNSSLPKLNIYIPKETKENYIRQWDIRGSRENFIFIEHSFDGI